MTIGNSIVAPSRPARSDAVPARHGLAAERVEPIEQLGGTPNRRTESLDPAPQLSSTSHSARAVSASRRRRSCASRSMTGLIRVSGASAGPTRRLRAASTSITRAERGGRAAR